MTSKGVVGLALTLLAAPALAQDTRPAFITGGALMTVAPQAAPAPAKGEALRRDFEAFMQTQEKAKEQRPAPPPARSIDEVQLEPFKAVGILRQLEAETSPYTHDGLERLKLLRQAIVELEAVHRGMLELARQTAREQAAKP